MHTSHGLKLDEGQKAFEPMARRLQDGLETDDADIGTQIATWYIRPSLLDVSDDKVRYGKLRVDHQLQKHAGTAVTS